jgi:hypothetical protein
MLANAQLFLKVNNGAGVAQSVQCLTTDWTTGVRSPAETEDSSSCLCVQTSSEAHRASYPMGIIGPLQEVKRGQGVTPNNSVPSNAEAKNE